MQNTGWRLDYLKFRIYLKDKFRISRAYYFIGKIPGNEDIYNNLESCGYTLIYKPTLLVPGKGYKGNCDAELVLQAMITFGDYEKAVIVTSDGDFGCLVEYLSKEKKLEKVIAPRREGCSILLRKAAGPKIDYIDNLKTKLEYAGRRRSTP